MQPGSASRTDAFGRTPIEVFASQLYAARSLIAGYMQFYRHVKSNAATGILDENEKPPHIIANSGKHFAHQLRQLIQVNPLHTPRTDDEAIAERVWAKFFNEVNASIALIENVGAWLESGISAPILDDQLPPELHRHTAQLEKIRSLLNTLQSEEERPVTTRLNPTAPAFQPRHTAARPPRWLRQAAVSSKGSTGQELNFTPRLPVHAQTQTILSESRQTGTQTEIRASPTADSTTQTDPAATERKRVHPGPHQRKKQGTKGVQTIRVQAIDTATQSDFENIDALRQGWAALQAEVSDRTDELLACAGEAIGPDCWKEGKEISKAFGELKNRTFDLFNRFYQYSSASGMPDELQDMLETHWLPCMEKMLECRSCLMAALFQVRFPPQEQHKYDAVQDVIAVLDTAVTSAWQVNNLMRDFQWEQKPGKEALPQRMQSLFPDEPSVRRLVLSQYRAGQLTYGTDDIAPLLVGDPLKYKSPEVEKEDPVDRERWESHCIASLYRYQNMLFNDIHNRQGIFEHATEAHMEHVVFNMILPAIAGVKLLAQKKHAESRLAPDAASDIELQINVVLRDFQRALDRVLPQMRHSERLAADPKKKLLWDGLHMMARPESLGIVNDARSVQTQIERDIRYVYEAVAMHGDSRLLPADQAKTLKALIDAAPVAALSIFLCNSESTAALFKEWSSLIGEIKNEWRRELQANPHNAESAGRQKEYLAEAKEFYWKLIQRQVPEKREAAYLANFKKMLGPDRYSKSVYPSGRAAEPVRILEELNKTLGTRDKR